MSVQRDRITVVDLEATCWKKNRVPHGQQSEIIEIGICWLDTDTLKIHDKRGLLIQPTRSKISEFCTDLTSITPEMVADGMTFADACQVIRQDYHAQNYMWVSWGGYDLRMFVAQTDSFNVPYPFSPLHVDLKGVYADRRNDGKRIGMARALKRMEIQMDGRHHRGVDDAYNTAQILAKLLKEDGLALLEGYWQ